MLSEKVLTSLSHKKYREQHGLFLIEGPDVISHCLDKKFPMKEILIDDARKTKYSHMLSEAKGQGVDVHLMQVRNIDNIAETENSQGILAVGIIKHKNETFSDPGLSVYLDGVQDPGNVGAVIRSAAAAGFRSVIAGHGTADYYNPKVIRATAGTFANVNLIEDENGLMLAMMKQRGYEVTLTDVNRGKDYRLMTKKRDRVIVMGNEGEGV
ncbi:MAG: RNA methyltransferase, partial [Fibrobacteres bacterium]|nr:RNA methyltransferase [Fibrobacterota bacterium]